MTGSLSRRHFIGSLAIVGAGVALNVVGMRGFRIPFAIEPKIADTHFKNSDKNLLTSALNECKN